MIDPSLLSGLNSTPGPVEMYWIVKPWWITVTALASGIAGLIVGWSVGKHGSIFFRSRR